MKLSNQVIIITGANILADLGLTSLPVSREPFLSRAIANK